MSAQKLYTPEMLGLAVELAQWPMDEALALRGDARSQSCGSTLDITISADAQGRIERVGMRVRACAVGQAAAAIFARHAVGRDEESLRASLAAMRAWLAGEAGLPEWPDLGLIAAAGDYPGRHGAILLPWLAALAALSSARATGEPVANG